MKDKTVEKIINFYRFNNNFNPAFCLSDNPDTISTYSTSILSLYDLNESQITELITWAQMTQELYRYKDNNTYNYITNILNKEPEPITNISVPDNRFFMRIYIAYLKNLTEKHISLLVNDNNPFVKEAIIKNPLFCKLKASTLTKFFRQLSIYPFRRGIFQTFVNAVFTNTQFFKSINKAELSRRLEAIKTICITEKYLKDVNAYSSYEYRHYYAIKLMFNLPISDEEKTTPSYLYDKIFYYSHIANRLSKGDIISLYYEICDNDYLIKEFFAKLSKYIPLSIYNELARKAIHNENLIGTLIKYPFAGLEEMKSIINLVDKNDDFKANLLLMSILGYSKVSSRLVNYILCDTIENETSYYYFDKAARILVGNRYFDISKVSKKYLTVIIDTTYPRIALFSHTNSSILEEISKRNDLDLQTQEALLDNSSSTNTVINNIYNNTKYNEIRKKIKEIKK